MDFNLISQLDDELNDYFEGEVVIGNGKKTKDREEYRYSQYDTLESIDYAIASKYEKGDVDKDGTPKLYLNLVAFKAETAAKNIDIDVSNFAFIPEDSDSVYGALLLRKKFREWARERYYGELINEQVEAFPTYGSIVVKKVGKDVENIPLQKLRNPHDAKDLQTAKYVILEHTNMTREEMLDMPDWNLDNIEMEWDAETNVFERYGRVPLGYLKELKGEEAGTDDWDISVDTVSYIAPDVKASDPRDRVLFIEEIKDRPFLECHYKKVQGRWLGEGEVEKNLGNQVAKNMVFNLRKRGLAWSTKNIFQTMDDEMAANLVRQVSDGDVLKMSMAGGISRIDTSNRAIADFNSMDAEIDNNANQRSFTFEVATGETLPSGTPFRLGALLSNSVNSYYNLKREKLGIFQTKIVEQFLIPMFERENKDPGTIGIADGEDSFDILREAKKEAYVGTLLKKAVLKGEIVDPIKIRASVEDMANNTSFDFYSYGQDFWKTLKKKVAVEVTGESTDIKQQVETLVTLYTDQSQRGDPDAKKTLKRILAITGNKMPLSSPGMTPQQPQQAPDLQGLTNAVTPQLQ